MGSFRVWFIAGRLLCLHLGFLPSVLGEQECGSTFLFLDQGPAYITSFNFASIKSLSPNVSIWQVGASPK